jgi:outer membrane protein
MWSLNQHRLSFLLGAFCRAAIVVCFLGSISFAQEDFSISEVLNQVQQRDANVTTLANHAWWDPYVLRKTREASQPTSININSLLSLALANSAQINVYSEVPLIRETSVTEADAAFDWTKFAETMWRESNTPVGSTLTIGGGGNRYLDDQFTATAGLRKRLGNGSKLEVGQQVGWQDTNSNFFIPANQGTARLTLDYTMPLLKGSGRAYNTSLQVLSRVDVDVANEEFMRQLQSHLLEISRGYWSLYLERGSLAQKVKLYLKTNAIYEELSSRQNVDASPTQLSSARAARENRLSDLIRAQAATQNAETRLRALINAPELGTDDSCELLPTDAPAIFGLEIDFAEEVQQSLIHRPEIKAAVNEIKAACVRLDVASNEVLPQLNFVTQAFVAGLRGESNVGDAWVDQFATGAPSYSVGLQYEIPIGNRVANARQDRRRLELRQLREKYRAAIENVRAEVEVAVRELVTSRAELLAKSTSLSAAINEAETLEARWRMAVGGDGTSSLNLESLLRALERVTENEYEYLKALVTYNLSILNLRRADGTLLQWEQIDPARTCEDGIPRTQMIKGDSSVLDQAPDNAPNNNDFAPSVLNAHGR